MAPVITDPQCHFRDDNRAQAPTGHKPEDLEMKLKFMAIFTTMLYKSQKINLFSDLLTPC